LERLLPRHMQIIYLINWLHLDGVKIATGAEPAFLQRVSIIDETAGRRVRMGTLAFLGSHKINGVSALHTDLMRKTVFADLHGLNPDRITNKTNGITMRRWLFGANPALTKLLREVVGDRVLQDPSSLEKLADYADDAGMHDRLRSIRRDHKQKLARLIADRVGVEVSADAMFDVHIKRIHEYKRQLLNILETIALYDSMRSHPLRDWAPRVKIFAGKAAAGYHRAKLIIRLIHDVASVINSDPTVRGLLKVVFLPNYNVSLAEAIVPSADLSEQISTAGMEASGTGNMKLALNGALTIGTLDGANIEILERVGGENMFIFGLTAAEVEARKRSGAGAREAIERSPALREVLDAVASGVFCSSEPTRYRNLIETLIEDDRFLVTADFDAYAAAQRRVAELWHDRHAWWRASMLNTAHVGWFSSDRTISEYAHEIWNLPVLGEAAE
ncbi:MAG: glycogen/starch/alpha-glucan family phosphorylase, partial [Geminicoccaceae bacterium]